MVRRDFRFESKGVLVCSWFKPNNWPDYPRTVKVKSETWKQVGGVEVEAAVVAEVELDAASVIAPVPSKLEAVSWDNLPTYVPTMKNDKSAGYFVLKQTITVPMPRIVVELLGAEQAEVGIFVQLKTDPSFTDGTYSKPEGIKVTANGFGQTYVKHFGEPQKRGTTWVTDLVLALRTEVSAIIPIPHLIIEFDVECTGLLVNVDVDYDVVTLIAWFVSAMGLSIRHRTESDDDGWELLPLV